MTTRAFSIAVVPMHALVTAYHRYPTRLHGDAVARIASDRSGS